MPPHPQYVHQEYPKWVRLGDKAQLVGSQEEEDAVLADWTAPPQPIQVPPDTDNALKRGPGRPRKIQPEQESSP